MSNARSQSLRAITHQLDAWLTQHGDRTQVLRAMLLLQDELHAMEAPERAADPAAGLPPRGPSQPGQAPGAGGGQSQDLLASLLGGILPHSAVASVLQQAGEAARSLAGAVRPEDREAVTAAVAEVAAMARNAEARVTTEVRDILKRLGLPAGEGMRPPH